MCWKIRSPISLCRTFRIPQGFVCRNYFLCEWSVKGSYVLRMTLKLSSGRRRPPSLPHTQPAKCFLYLTLPNPLSVSLPTLLSPKEERVVMRFLFFSAVTPYQCNSKWTVVTCRNRPLVTGKRSGLLKRQEVADVKTEKFSTRCTSHRVMREWGTTLSEIHVREDGMW